MKTGYDEIITNEDGRYCFRCNVVMISDKVFMTYLKSTFPTQLLKCPKCGQVHIDEGIIIKKAAEVELILEEK